MTERSKVIRLGPEAQALKEAIAAPATPAPVPTVGKTVHLADPGPTPPPKQPNRSVTPGRTPAMRAPTPARTAARSPTPVRTPARSPTPPRTPISRTMAGRPGAPAPGPTPAPASPPARDPNATPPPSGPLPPARVRGYTPPPPMDPERTPAATPPPPLVDPRTANATGRATPTRQQPGARPTAAPGSSQFTMRGPAPTSPQRPSQPAPTVPASAPQPAQVRTRPTGPNPVVPPETPAYGVQRPQQQDFALARTLHAPTGPAPVPANHAAPHYRPYHETARVQFRPPRQWGGVFTVVLLLLAAAAVGFHLWVIPLDVLIAWRQPTGLSIKTDPPGASVRVDGVPLPSSAPATVTVWRDTNVHVIEASRPGYKTARTTIRYDKTASLSATLHLERDPNAPAAAPNE
jgi:hypothetical protein